MQIENAAQPLSLMVRMVVPGAAGMVREVGVELTDLRMQGQPISYEVSSIDYSRVAPVASRVRTWWVPEELHGDQTKAAIGQVYAGVENMKLDSGTAQSVADTKQLQPNQVRILRVDDPTSAPAVWTFDLAQAPAGIADVINAVAALANTSSWIDGKTSVRAGVPVWERERWSSRQ